MGHSSMFFLLVLLSGCGISDNDRARDHADRAITQLEQRNMIPVQDPSQRLLLQDELSKEFLQAIRDQ